MTGPGLRFAGLPFLNHGEGQPFDRPSLFHGLPAEKQPRDRRELRDQLARSVAGVAKAEAGVLILAIEHDLAIRGHQLPPKHWRACWTYHRRAVSLPFPENPPAGTG
jgi:hypothetical protein